MSVREGKECIQSTTIPARTYRHSPSMDSTGVSDEFYKGISGVLTSNQDEQDTVCTIWQVLSCVTLT